MRDMATRNRAILAAYKAGANGNDLGRQYGLHRERIYQIIKKMEPGAVRSRSEAQRLLRRKSPRHIKKCLECGEAFEHNPWMERKYCSTQCKAKAFRTPTARQCYEARKLQMNWSDIAALFGIKNQVVAINKAKAHAIRLVLQWPLPVPRIVRDTEGESHE